MLSMGCSFWYQSTKIVSLCHRSWLWMRTNKLTTHWSRENKCKCWCSTSLSWCFRNSGFGGWTCHRNWKNKVSECSTGSLPTKRYCDSSVPPSNCFHLWFFFLSFFLSTILSFRNSQWWILCDKLRILARVIWLLFWRTTNLFCFSFLN